MTAFKDKLILLATEDMRVLAGYLVELMRQDPDLVKDTAHLKVSLLSKAIGISTNRIRAAIKARHYGYIHPGQGKRDQYYATVTEARAYHFGSEGKTRK